MGFTLTLVIIGGFIAFGLSFSIGANDAANALGTSVGSRALSLRQAIYLGGIFEFLGCFLLGSFVSGTLKADIVSPKDFDDQGRFAIGMFASLVSATVILLIATWWALPVSTTQTIVGSVIGFGFVAKGADALDGATLTKIALSWISTPLISFVLSYIFYYIIVRAILEAPDPAARSKRLVPYVASLTMAVLGAFLVSSQRKIFKFNAMWIPIAFAVVLCLTYPIYRFVVQPYASKLARLGTQLMLADAARGEEEVEMPQSKAYVKATTGDELPSPSGAAAMPLVSAGKGGGAGGGGDEEEEDEEERAAEHNKTFSSKLSKTSDIVNHIWGSDGAQSKAQPQEALEEEEREEKRAEEEEKAEDEDEEREREQADDGDE